jgi:hypothetical protein
VLVTVNTDDVSDERLRTELEQLGGRTYGRESRKTEVQLERED